MPLRNLKRDVVGCLILVIFLLGVSLPASARQAAGTEKDLAVADLYNAPVAVCLPETSLDQYVRAYQLEGEPDIISRQDGRRLMATFGPASQEFLPPSEAEIFNRRNRYAFLKGSGKGVAIVLPSNYGADQKAIEKIQP